jgi:enamine deaminase RidA (YjgF/YER057c/UK114 family)
MSVYDRLKELGVEVPKVDARFVFVPAVQTGNLLFVSGQTPEIDGEMQYAGVLGEDLDIETGKKAARLAALNCLGEMEAVLGSLDRVARIVRVIGYVRSARGFGEQPLVVIRAAEYCLTFTFAYNVHFPPETECGRRGMRTRGFGAISPETAFVCWWFALQGNAFLELWRETDDPRWKEYAVAVIRASMQMMTRRGDTFGLAEHLLGIRAEVIPVLDTVKGGHIWKKGMTGYTWHQPVWWPAAFNLLNVAVIEDGFPAVSAAIES